MIRTLAEGTVINLNAFGATVRLANGALGVVPASEVNANRARFTQAYHERGQLTFELAEGRRNTLRLIDSPLFEDQRFEEQIAHYLKETEEWELADAPPAHERHFLKKKRRAARFESHSP